MNKSMITITSAIFFAALTSGHALAAVNKEFVDDMVRSNISGDSMILTNVDDSTVILTGYFGGTQDKNEVLTALSTAEGVERIVDYTVVKYKDKSYLK